MNQTIHGMTRLHLADCVSTQDYLAQRLEEMAPLFPVCITADEQTGGRGRWNRVWHSPRGLGLYLSWGFQLERPEALPWVPLAAGLAVCRALGVRRWNAARIKWPNDILIRDRKLAGILSESRTLRENIVCLCGIGLNVNQRKEDFPEDIRGRAVSLRMLTGREHSREILLGRLCHQLQRVHGRLEKGEFPGLLRAVRRRTRWMKGRPLRFHVRDSWVAGTAQGLAADGGLMLRRNDGGQEILYSGEVEMAPGRDAGGLIPR